MNFFRVNGKKLIFVFLCAALRKACDSYMPTYKITLSEDKTTKLTNEISLRNDAVLVSASSSSSSSVMTCAGLPGVIFSISTLFSDVDMMVLCTLWVDELTVRCVVVGMTVLLCSQYESLYSMSSLLPRFFSKS